MNKYKELPLTQMTEASGCAAKLGPGVLAEILEGLPNLTDPRLLVGFDTSDDACVYQITEEIAAIHTVDFFPPMVGDPYLFGQIAATNALSDVYAMGGTPAVALNLLCVPNCLPKEVIRQILQGGHEKAVEAGCIIAGGHSVQSSEPKYGLSVTGYVHPKHIYKNTGAKPGDVLVLTKPLGTGILTTAAKADLLEPGDFKAMADSMTTLNRTAASLLEKLSTVHACTDVTGFGLLGHTCEMAQGSDVQITLRTGDMDLIGESLEFARMGLLPEGMYRNRQFAEKYVDGGAVELAVQDMLYDPQTSGGLLIAVDPDDAPALFAELQSCVPSAQCLGTVEEYKGGARIYLQ